MRRKNKADKDKSFKLKEKFIFGTAMLGAMVGYGRGAHAACTLFGPGIYVCTGSPITTQLMIYGAPYLLAETIGTGFSVITTSGDAIDMKAKADSGYLTFRDTFASTITGAITGINAYNDASGALSITTTGDVTGTSGDGIYALNSYNGTALMINAATVTGGINGIFTKNYGYGALSIMTTGDVTGTSGDGIYAYNSINSSGTDLTINAVNVTGGTSGIFTKNSGTGALSITTTGDVTSTNGSGITAYSYGTALTINAATVTGSIYGINAYNFGAGALNITTTNDVTGTGGDGVFAFNSESGTDLTIHETNVTGGIFGIDANNIGLGALSITTTGDVTGSGGNGILAQNGSIVYSTGTALTINAATITGSTNGIFAQNYGLGALSITTTGDVTGTGAAGIYAKNGSKAYSTGTDLTINAATVTGGTYGIFVYNFGSGALNITTTGDVTGTSGDGINAYGANGANVITVEAGSLVQGGTSAIYANTTSTMSIFNHGTIQNLSMYSMDPVMNTVGATIITNTGLITGQIALDANNLLINDNTWNTAGGTNTFGINSSVENNAGGKIITANAQSALPVTTNFNFTGLGTLTNAGVITMSNGVAGDKTAITGNFMGVGNGQIWMDTMLGGSLSTTDQFVLDGGSATGSTLLFINNAGGIGAMTSGDGIKVVDAINGATTTSSAFALGNSLVVGAYDYNLFYGGVGAHALDQDWYLRSSYRNEVPVNMIAPVLAQQFGMTMLDTLDDRVGSKVVQDNDSVNPKSGAWLRIIGQTGNRTNGHDVDAFAKNGPSYNWNMGGIQGGYDLYRDTHENKSSDVVGLDFGYGHMNANVDQVYNSNKAGDLSMNGYSVAAYWTHYVANGWYTDAVLQGTGLDNIRTQAVNGQNLSTNGYGYLASLETGWKLDYSNQVSVTPEAQVVYQSVNLSRKADAYALFNFNASDSTYARIGGRVSKAWEAGGRREGVITWGRVNVWHNFNDEANTTISTLSGLNPVTLGADLGNSWAQFSLGASRRVNQGLTLFTSGDIATYFAGSNGQFWSGRLGAKYVY